MRWSICLRLFKLNRNNAFKVHPSYRKWQDFLPFHDEYSTEFIYHIFFIHPSIQHVGCSHALAILNDAETVMRMRISLQQSDCVSFKSMLRSGTVGSCGSSGVFLVEKYLCCVLRNGCTRLPARLQHTSGPFSPHPYQCLVSLRVW